MERLRFRDWPDSSRLGGRNSPKAGKAVANWAEALTFPYASCISPAVPSAQRFFADRPPETAEPVPETPIFKLAAVSLEFVP